MREHKSLLLMREAATVNETVESNAKLVPLPPLATPPLMKGRQRMREHKSPPLMREVMSVSGRWKSDSPIKGAKFFSNFLARSSSGKLANRKLQGARSASCFHMIWPHKRQKWSFYGNSL